MNNPPLIDSSAIPRWLWIAFALVLAGCAAIYWPGLSGALLLDDYPNLGDFAHIDKTASLYEWLAYSTADISGATGRLLPLLTFAIQSALWQFDPWQFKLVNLIIHLANGALLLGLVMKMTGLAGYSRHEAIFAALVAASLWLLHPLNVSTVLYVIQRMTQMAVLFTIIGLVCYLHGRSLLVRGSRAGWWWACAGTGLSYLLALMCKETGALMPLYILVAELTLFRSLERPRYWKAWALIYIFLPLSAIFAYLAWNIPAYQEIYIQRGYGLADRLVTEAGVLLDYLKMSLMPRPQSLGIFHDDYMIVSSLYDRVMVGGAFLLVVIIGVACRHRWAFVSFGIFWFLAGHVLEASVVPLELYFEHRNYLPLSGIAVTFGIGSVHLIRNAKDNGIYRHAINSMLLFILAMASVITALESRLWGNPIEQARQWANERPLSLRAQENLANTYAAMGDYAGAARIFSRMARGELNSPASYISWLRVVCYSKDANGLDLDEAASKLRSASYSSAPLAALVYLVADKEDGKCTSADVAMVPYLIMALIDNPNYETRTSQLYGILGRLYLAEGKPLSAIEFLKKAYRRAPEPGTALYLSRAYAAAGDWEQAQANLERAKANSAGQGIRGRRIAIDIEQWEQGLKKMSDAK